MLYFAYLLPFVACLLLHLVFNYHGEWTVYLWIIIAGEAVVCFMHWLFYRWQTYGTEFHGSLVSAIYHEYPWVELVPVTVTRRDSKGNTYTTTRIVERWHPESYYFDTTRKSRISSNEEFFNYVTAKWGQPIENDRWTSPSIKGGARFGRHSRMNFFLEDADYDDGRWISVTEKKKYINKIRKSNSIFKFIKVDKKQAQALGLHEYPEIIGHDAECILSGNFEVDKETRLKFRRFNGALAPRRQMRLFVLLFDAGKGAGISEMQRAYWQGGNKNEFVVCIGLHPDGRIEWARCFSWADNQQLEVDTAQWLMNRETLDWNHFFMWFLAGYRKWNRKEFSDFNYINVSFPLWQIAVTYLICILENIGALWIVLK